jgi:hypothetical protein
MAGIFGDEISSRADFFRLLDEARKMVAALLPRWRNEDSLSSVGVQLDAIKQWTANGRTPAPDERSKIGMGLRMTREFGEERDPEIQQLRQAVMSLDHYVKYWPDDATASDPDNIRLIFRN